MIDWLDKWNEIRGNFYDGKYAYVEYNASEGLFDLDGKFTTAELQQLLDAVETINSQNPTQEISYQS